MQGGVGVGAESFPRPLVLLAALRTARAIPCSHLGAEQVPLQIDSPQGCVDAEGERYRRASGRRPARHTLGLLVAPADGVVAEVELGHRVVVLHGL